VPKLGSPRACPQLQPDATICAPNRLGEPGPVALAVYWNSVMTKLPLMFVSETCEELFWSPVPNTLTGPSSVVPSACT
jgi:hypothetical protein